MMARGGYHGHGNPNAYTWQRSHHPRGIPRLRGGACPSAVVSRQPLSTAINPSKDSLSLFQIKEHHRQVLQRHPEATAALASVYQLHLAAVTASKEAEQVEADARRRLPSLLDLPLLTLPQADLALRFPPSIQKPLLQLKQDKWHGSHTTQAIPIVKQEPPDYRRRNSESDDTITVHLGVAPIIRKRRASETERATLKKECQSERRQKEMEQLKLLIQDNDRQLEAILKGRSVPLAREPSPEEEEEFSSGDVRSRSSNSSEGSGHFDRRSYSNSTMDDDEWSERDLSSGDDTGNDVKSLDGGDDEGHGRGDGSEEGLSGDEGDRSGSGEEYDSEDSNHGDEDSEGQKSSGEEGRQLENLVVDEEVLEQRKKNVQEAEMIFDVWLAFDRRLSCKHKEAMKSALIPFFRDRMFKDDVLLLREVRDRKDRYPRDVLTQASNAISDPVLRDIFDRFVNSLSLEQQLYVPDLFRPSDEKGSDNPSSGTEDSEDDPSGEDSEGPPLSGESEIEDVNQEKCFDEMRTIFSEAVGDEDGKSIRTTMWAFFMGRLSHEGISKQFFIQGIEKERNPRVALEWATKTIRDSRLRKVFSDFVESLSPRRQLMVPDFFLNIVHCLIEMEFYANVEWCEYGGLKALFRTDTQDGSDLDGDGAKESAPATSPPHPRIARSSSPGEVTPFASHPTSEERSLPGSAAGEAVSNEKLSADAQAYRRTRRKRIQSSSSSDDGQKNALESRPLRKRRAS